MPRELREKIMLIGASGTGKTYAHLCIARSLPDVDFYVIDTDDSLGRSLQEFDGLSNVHSRLVYGWEELTEATDWVKEEAGPDDWIVIDRVDMPWEWVRDYYAREVYGQDPADYIMKRRQQMDADRPMSVGEFGQGDWVTIKRLHNDSWLRPLIYQVDAHLLTTTRPKPIYDEVDQETDMLFSSLGVLPGGEKRLPHYFHTIMLLQRTRAGREWRVTTVKDRGREEFIDQKLTDFGRQYIRRLAGMGG